MATTMVMIDVVMVEKGRGQNGVAIQWEVVVVVEGEVVADAVLSIFTKLPLFKVEN